LTGLAVQEAFARLATDAPTRWAFMHGDESFLAGYPLTAAEMAGFRRLRGGERAGFELFVDHLGVRRAKRVAALMPLSRALVGDGPWTQAWSFYQQDAMGETCNTPEADAHGFACKLSALTVERDPQVAALVQYEGCKAVVSAAPHPVPRRVFPGARLGVESYPLIQPGWLTQSFEFDLLVAVQVLKSTGALPTLAPERVHVLFYRSWRNGHVATARLSPALVSLLALCDGTHHYQEVIDHAGGDATAHEMLARLEQAGVLVFAGPAARGIGQCRS